MESKPPEKSSTEHDAEKKKKSTSSTANEGLLAGLPKAARGKAEEFLTEADDVLLERASGPQMKKYFAAKIELFECIKQGGDQYNKIPAILEEFPQLNSFKTRALHGKMLQLKAELLQHVAQGEQGEPSKPGEEPSGAKKLLIDNPDMAQKLLRTPGLFTDYSGRTFNCTAYEYAYWAKDTHMCRMLEKHMDEDTKADMLKRCEAMDLKGLTYEQRGEVKNSKHFDLMLPRDTKGPLLQAMQDYIDGYDAWQGAGNYVAMKAAWMRVGLAQRDLPVHVINEYCRRDRSFDPLPPFNEKNLPRVVTYYNYNTGLDVPLFPLVVSGVSGLGVDFALVRRGGCVGASGVASPFSGSVSVDLAAASHLDEVRTADLTRSREILALAAPDHGFRLS